MADEKEDFVNLVVASRVRPFTAREKDQGAENIVTISGAKTTIEDPNNTGVFKNFEFDYSFDSDTDQAQVFNDIGKGVVEKILQGYNCSLFAYGQTGTGKSHTIMGDSDVEALYGICPRILNELFIEIYKRQYNKISPKVTIDVLEVYNEAIYDLLTEDRGNHLQLRAHRTKGTYVKDLTNVLVNNFSDASKILSLAIDNRVVAATQMNIVSSRSQMVVGIDVELLNVETKTVTTSHIQFVDLAGSERVSKSGSTGNRLNEEGAAINMSLSALGGVIAALADRSRGKEKIFVPYRTSVVTRLMRETLGGNSYTVMFVTISPANINYDESLSTLRYGSRARTIKNYPKIQQTAVDTIIENLKKETQELKEYLNDESHMEFLAEGADKDIKDNIQRNEAKILRLRKTLRRREEIQWLEEKMKEQQIHLQERTKERQDAQEKRLRERIKLRKSVPYLTNLHEDSTFSGKVLHFIDKGRSITVGNPRESTSDKPDVMLMRARINQKHAMLKNKDGSVTVMPLGGPVYVNGKKVPVEEMPLEHNDRIMFGKSFDSIYVFKDPLNDPKVKTRTSENISYDFAKREIARYADVELYLGSEDIFLKELVVNLEQTVEEANAMAKELNRPVRYDIVLISALSLDEVKDMCHIFIQCQHTEDDITREFLWTKDDFYDRFAMMTTEYGKSGQKSDPSKTQTVDEKKMQDPFLQPAEVSRLIGVVFVPLSGLSSMSKKEDEFGVSSTKTNGYINVGLCPCTKDGEEINDFIDPTGLLGREINFQIKIMDAKDLPDEFKETWCQYSFYMDSEDVETQSKIGRNPTYDFCKRYRQTNVTQNFIEYLETNQLIIQVFGRETIAKGIDEEVDEEKESLKQKIKELRERKKVKHNKLSEKKKEIKELKEEIDQLKSTLDENNSVMRQIAEKAKDSKDSLAKEISELLKSRIK